MAEKNDLKKQAETIKALGDPKLDPHEIDFLPMFEQGRGPRGAFINDSGVVIGDHDYDSPQSPLNNWTKDTDPSVMAGEEWVHPYKDIGFQTEENRDYFERGISPQGGIYMHPTRDVAYEASLENADGEPPSDAVIDEKRERK
ncbi:DUF3905 domain-containing protein [Paenibacillus thermotolerans]|uniref:DUF3905 domain-containing protein n=1 Tax=Paenibacillus thermotolerans TaxID=3027807 RepID=UPI0023682E34|nr:MULTISPECIES: DUF3905 domain-containing protein [unclassified Paenibacillus]